MRDALRKQEEETEFDNMRRVAKVGALFLRALCCLQYGNDVLKVRDEHNAVFQAQLEVLQI